MFIRLFQIWSIFTGILFLLFIFFIHNNVEGASKGHLYFFGIFLFLGLLGLYGVMRWLVQIKDNVIEIQYALKKNKLITFDQINKIKLGSESQVKVFVNNKKIITIYALTVNYDLFLSELKNREIPIESLYSNHE